MSTLLTLLVACCAARGVSPAVTPLRFAFHHDDAELPFDTPPSAAFNDPLPRRSITFGGVPEQPASGRFSNPVGRTLGERIVFSGESSSGGGRRDPGETTFPSDPAHPLLYYPNGFHKLGIPIDATSDCGLKDSLTMSYEGTPWTLLTQGHCPDGEWGVMGPECQPECRPKPCPKGQLEYQWRENEELQKRCVNLTDSTICSEGQILYLNQGGSTFCDCEQDSFYYPWHSQCYARRERGPCDFGFFLDINNQSGAVGCMPSDCEMSRFEKEPVSGKCYRKDFVGYCPIESLEFYHNNQTVGCFILDIRNLFDVAITRSCSSGSLIDHLGQCRQQIVVPSITSLPRSRTSGCRSGAISVGSGPCRRVNSYFS